MRFVRFDYSETKPAGDFVPTSVDLVKDGEQDAVIRCAGSAETSGFAELTRRAWRLYEKTEPTVDLPPRNNILPFVHKLMKNDGSFVECDVTVTLHTLLTLLLPRLVFGWWCGTNTFLCATPPKKTHQQEPPFSQVTKLGADRLVMVVRDISERVARHEAEKELAFAKAARECDTERDARHEVEKELLSQKTARESDAFANRFMRHEVKNGLLSAIGIADAIHEMHHDPSTDPPTCEEPAVHELGVDDAAMDQWIGELQTMLTDTLHSVLSEAMARDLVHDTSLFSPPPRLSLSLSSLQRDEWNSMFRAYFGETTRP